MKIDPDVFQDKKGGAMEKILIVDDESSCREALRFIFGNSFELSFAENGVRALRILKETVFDLILLDLNMPGLSGVEFMHRIQALGNRADILVVSAYGTLSNATKVVNYGGTGIISKPFDVVEIVNTVTRIMKERKHRMDLEILNKRIKGSLPSTREYHGHIPG
jgi:DNA-binding NtrC family response regulator